MDDTLYKLEIAEAEKAKTDGRYSDAVRHYKRSLKYAAPEVMQDIFNTIIATKEEAKKLDATKALEKRQPDSLGFIKYTKTFNDVIGYKRHKKLAKRIIQRSLAEGNLLGWFKIPKSTGILLYGPPGTGKTLFAKALSGEFGIPMKDAQINQILGKLVGESEKNMAKIFEDAKQIQPSIIFFDELDALGAARENANESTSNDVKNTVNVLLKELSELHDNKEMRVYVIGATNLPWMIDSAIKRSGRIEHTIYIGPPNFFDRIALFRYYLELTKTGNHYGKGIDLITLSLASIRMSQADIETACQYAFRVAEEKGRKSVTTRDIQKAIKEKKDNTLDNWYLEAKTTYIKKKKEVVHRTGFMGWNKQKERIEEQGKMSKEELKIYRPLINNLNSTIRWWHVTNVIRFVARGM